MHERYDVKLKRDSIRGAFASSQTPLPSAKLRQELRIPLVSRPKTPQEPQHIDLASSSEDLIARHQAILPFHTELSDHSRVGLPRSRRMKHVHVLCCLGIG